MRKEVGKLPLGPVRAKAIEELWHFKGSLGHCILLLIGVIPIEMADDGFGSWGD